MENQSEITTAPIVQVDLDYIHASITNETDPLKIREFILQIEAGMMGASNTEGFETPGITLQHGFAEGVYVREMTIPVGTVIVGKIHRREHFSFLMRGDISVLTEEGLERMQAPRIMRNPPGTKRIGYAHSDVQWVNVHPAETTDLDEIEHQVTARNYEELGLTGIPAMQPKLLGEKLWDGQQ